MPHHFGCIIAVACLCLAMPLASSQYCDFIEGNVSWSKSTYPEWMKNSTPINETVVWNATDDGPLRASIPLWGLSNLSRVVIGPMVISFRWNCSIESDSIDIIRRDGNIKGSGLFFLIDGKVEDNCTSSNSEYTKEIPEGVHQLTWTLSKKTRDNRDLIGWIDEICITSPIPNCTIDANNWAAANSPATASVPFAGAGAQYHWSVSGGTVEFGNGTQSIIWSYPRAGLTNISVTITRNGTSSSCSKLVNIWECNITAPDNIAPNSTNIASVPDAGSNAGYYWLIEGGAAISGQSERNFTWMAGEGESVLLIATVTINDIPYHCSKTVYTTGECLIIAPEQVVAGTTFEARVDYSGQWGTPEWSIDGERVYPREDPDRITWTADWPGQVVISIAIPGTDIRCNKTVEVLPNCNITAPKAACAWQPNLEASVRDAGPGASYSWGVSGGELLRGQGTSLIEWKAGRGEADNISVEVRANGAVNNGTWRIPINQSCVYLTYCDDLQREIKNNTKLVISCEDCEGNQSYRGRLSIEYIHDLIITSESSDCNVSFDGDGRYATIEIGNSSDIHIFGASLYNMSGSGIYAENCSSCNISETDISVGHDACGINLVDCGNNNIQKVATIGINNSSGIRLWGSNDTEIGDCNIDNAVEICNRDSYRTNIINSIDETDIIRLIINNEINYCYLETGCHYCTQGGYEMARDMEFHCNEMENVQVCQTN